MNGKRRYELHGSSFLFLTLNSFRGRRGQQLFQCLYFGSKPAPPRHQQGPRRGTGRQRGRIGGELGQPAPSVPGLGSSCQAFGYSRQQDHLQMCQPAQPVGVRLGAGILVFQLVAQLSGLVSAAAQALAQRGHCGRIGWASRYGGRRRGRPGRQCLGQQ